MTQEQLLKKVLEKSIAAYRDQSIKVFNLEALLELRAIESDAKDKEIAELKKAAEAKASDDILELK